MVNYLSCFLPNLSDVMKPLRDLTHKDAVWYWDDPQETAWNDVSLCLHPFWRTTSPLKFLRSNVIAVRVDLEQL